jgi:rod shape-determining protein MreD
MAFQSQLGSSHILLPAKGGFIALTLVIALMLDLLPWSNATGVPDWLALVIVFWSVHEPRRMGIGSAWALGLVMDAANGALLGQHALAYSLLAFSAIALSRRLLWFALWPQALHVFVMMLGAQLVMLAIRLSAGGAFPGVLFFLGSVLSAALWPFITYALLAPQRRAQDADHTRPI